MKLFKKKEVFVNANTQFDISQDVQRKLMNGNTQFIINLASQVQINSYSTVCLAAHITHYFFQQKSYLQYDRLIIATASFLLSQKIKDGDPRIRKLSQAYYSIVQSFEPQKMANDVYNNYSNWLTNKIQIAESRILRVIEYDFDIKLPFDYLDYLCKRFIPKGIEEDLFHTIKILLLDSYRTYASLIFNPYVILIGCFLISCSQVNYSPYKSPPPSININQNATEEEVYQNWLNIVEKELQDFDYNRSIKPNNKEKLKLTQEDIKDFLIVFNELLFLKAGDNEMQTEENSKQEIVSGSDKKNGKQEQK